MTMDVCEQCGDRATQWDYDQFMYFCDRHRQQADFTVPLEALPALSEERKCIVEFGREYIRRRVQRPGTFTAFDARCLIDAIEKGEHWQERGPRGNVGKTA